MSAWLRRYLDGGGLPGDLDLIQPEDDLEPCPSCGARSGALGYRGHSMRCLGFYRELR